MPIFGNCPINLICWTTRWGVPHVVSVMTPSMQYAIAPDGEIVKVLEDGYEFTGMYILRN